MTFMRWLAVILVIAFLVISAMPFVCPDDHRTREETCGTMLCTFNVCDPGNAVLAVGMMPCMHEARETTLQPQLSETVFACPDVFSEYLLATKKERPPAAV